MNALLIAAALSSGAAPLSSAGAAPLPVPRITAAAMRDAAALESVRLSAAVQPISSSRRPDPWLSEDKLRHAAASWTVAVFSYATVRAVGNADTALAVALPVTAAAGLTKEVFDRRAGGPFSLRDLVADAVGASAAWLVLREVR